MMSGGIAPDLASKIAIMLSLSARTAPSAFHIQIGEYSGVVVQDKSLKNKLSVTPSMKQFDIQGTRRSELQNTVMIVKYSKPTRPAHLNRRLILGLGYLGVPRQVYFNAK